MGTQEVMMPVVPKMALGSPVVGNGLGAQLVDIEMSFGPTENREPEQNRLQAAWGAGKNAIKVAAIAIELLPVTNEGIRFGAFTYTQTLTHNPLVGAAVLGGTTMLIEGSSALAASKWVADDKIKDVIDRADEKLSSTIFAVLSPKRYIPEKPHVSPAVEAGLAMTLGALAVLEAKQREDSERTPAQNIRRGLFTAGWLSSVFAIEGALMSEGIDNPTSPSSVGMALLGMAGLVGFSHWAKGKIQGKSKDVEAQ